MSRRFRICVAKGVRGRFRLSYGGGRSVPYFPKNSCECGVTKNRYGHNFQNIGSKINQRLLIGYEPMLICFGSDICPFEHSIYLFFLNEGQLRPLVTQPLTPPEAQKPKTFRVATFYAQKLSGRSARNRFSRQA